MKGKSKKRPIPGFLRALGRADAPERVTIAGVDYTLERCYKHDFFACTSLYRRVGEAQGTGGAEKIVLKIARRADFFGLPCAWIGRWLADREVSAYRALADVGFVPRLVGRFGQTGFAHEYIEGHHLEKGWPVPDDFFDRLERAVSKLHGRRMAYVDLEKRQNVLVGEDGRPWLIDFQISWQHPAGWLGRSRLADWMCRRFQEGDRYHLLKLRRRIRPDQLSREQIARSYTKPSWVRWHARVTAPLLKLRRGALRRIDPAGASAERGTVSR